MAKGNFKQSVSNFSKKTKAFVSDKATKVKNYSKEYGSDMRQAYQVGYKRGWEDAYEIPNRFGARAVASYGYGRGVKKHHAADKSVENYKKLSKY